MGCKESDTTQWPVCITLCLNEGSQDSHLDRQWSPRSCLLSPSPGLGTDLFLVQGWCLILSWGVKWHGFWSHASWECLDSRVLRSLVNIYCFLLVPVVGTPIPDPELVYASRWSHSHISGAFWLTLHLKHEWCRFKIQSCALCSFFWLSLHFVKVFPFLFF